MLNMTLAKPSSEIENTSDQSLTNKLLYQQHKLLLLHLIMKKNFHLYKYQQ